MPTSGAYVDWVLGDIRKSLRWLIVGKQHLSCSKLFKPIKRTIVQLNESSKLSSKTKYFCNKVSLSHSLCLICLLVFLIVLPPISFCNSLSIVFKQLLGQVADLKTEFQLGAA